jgi:hypothetical protein
MGGLSENDGQQSLLVAESIKISLRRR